MLAPAMSRAKRRCQGLAWIEGVCEMEGGRVSSSVTENGRGGRPWTKVCNGTCVDDKRYLKTRVGFTGTTALTQAQWPAAVDSLDEGVVRCDFSGWQWVSQLSQRCIATERRCVGHATTQTPK